MCNAPHTVQKRLMFIKPFINDNIDLFNLYDNSTVGNNIIFPTLMMYKLKYERLKQKKTKHNLASLSAQ